MLFYLPAHKIARACCLASFLLLGQAATAHADRSATNAVIPPVQIPTVADNAPSSLTTTAAQSSHDAKEPTAVKPEMTMEQFLDKLMAAESGGNDQARNPLSSATGAYQFIESTFLSVMRRHFPQRIEKLDAAAILNLRTDREVARAAAKAFTEDNATQLVAAGHASSFPHLRLAFLLGVTGAVRIPDAKPGTPLATLLGPTVLRANPWMGRHTAETLIARAAREVSLLPTTLAGIKPRRDPITGELILPSRISTAPQIRVRCNLARPSCKRWLALKRRAIAAKADKAATNTNRRLADTR